MLKLKILGTFSVLTSCFFWNTAICCAKDKADLSKTTTNTNLIFSGGASIGGQLNISGKEGEYLGDLNLQGQTDPINYWSLIFSGRLQYNDPKLRLEKLYIDKSESSESSQRFGYMRKDFGLEGDTQDREIHLRPLSSSLVFTLMENSSLLGRNLRVHFAKNQTSGRLASPVWGNFSLGSGTGSHLSSLANLGIRVSDFVNLHASLLAQLYRYRETKEVVGAGSVAIQVALDREKDVLVALEGTTGIEPLQTQWLREANQKKKHSYFAGGRAQFSYKNKVDFEEYTYSYLSSEYLQPDSTTKNLKKIRYTIGMIFNPLPVSLGFEANLIVSNSRLNLSKKKLNESNLKATLKYLF